MFQDKLQFSRQKLEFWYSIGILVLIPVLIAINTIWLIVGVRKNIDYELFNKVNFANESAAAALVGQIENQEKAQATITQLYELRQQNQDLDNISLISGSTPDELKVVASSNKELVGKTGEDASDEVVKRALISSSPITTELKNSEGRFYHVATPVKDKQKIVGVVISDISVAASDTRLGSLLMRSVVVMVASIAVVVLLLANHFKFVEYALLFRRLKEVDQMKDDFLSVATHELKAPMSVIKGNIENINDGLMGPVEPKVKEALAKMYGETERLNNLVNDLLNVSRLEQGRISYTIEPVNIELIITDVVNQYQQKAFNKGIKIDYQKTANLPIVKADKGRTIEIITNLVDNAVKYSMQGSVIISHKVEENNLQTSIRDTGIGMSAANRERLFTRFYRIQNEKTKKISGTGLGLWIIKQYIEAMGGKIYVESMEGVGSEFVFSLPINNESHESKSDHQSPLST